MKGQRLFVSGCAAFALLALTGCRHAVRIAAPPPPPVPVVSVPPPTHRFESLPPIETESLPPLMLDIPRRPLPRFRPRPTTARQLARLLPPAPPPATLGELTTGGGDTNDELRQETASLLRSQQQRLQAVPRSAAALHSQQLDQARLFLRQAIEAWHTLDVQGAHVLATKVKVLLDEL